MNKVISVRAKTMGVVLVGMAEGRRGEFDVRPYMVSDFFRELENETYFGQVRVFFQGIGWPNGQDLGPDTVAAELREIENPSLRATQPGGGPGPACQGHLPGEMSSRTNRRWRQRHVIS